MLTVDDVRLLFGNEGTEFPDDEGVNVAADGKGDCLDPLSSCLTVEATVRGTGKPDAMAATSKALRKFKCLKFQSAPGEREAGLENSERSSRQWCVWKAVDKGFGLARDMVAIYSAIYKRNPSRKEEVCKARKLAESDVTDDWTVALVIGDSPEGKSLHISLGDNTAISWE